MIGINYDLVAYNNLSEAFASARKTNVLKTGERPYRQWFEFAHHSLGLLEHVNIDSIGLPEAYVHALMVDGQFICPKKEKEKLQTYLTTHFKDIKCNIALSIYKLYTSLYLLFIPPADGAWNQIGFTRPLSQFTMEKLKQLKCIAKQYSVCDNVPDYEWNNIEMMTDVMLRTEELTSTKHKLSMINQYTTIDDRYAADEFNGSDAYANTNMFVYDERRSLDLSEVADILGFFIKVREFDITNEDDVKELYRLSSGRALKIAISLLGILYFLTYDIYPYDRAFKGQLEAKAWMDQLPSYEPNAVVLYKDLRTPIKKYKNAMYDKPSRNDDGSITYLYWLYCILNAE